MRDTVKQIGLGCLALISIPVVGLLAASHHVAVGIAVTIVYGSAAAVVAISIGRGTMSIAAELRARVEAKRLAMLPRARLLDDGSSRFQKSSA